MTKLFAIERNVNQWGQLEIPMEFFTRAVEIVLKDAEWRDRLSYRPGIDAWQGAARRCGYVQSPQATSQTCMSIPRAA